MKIIKLSVVVLAGVLSFSSAQAGENIKNLEGVKCVYTDWGSVEAQTLFRVDPSETLILNTVVGENGEPTTFVSLETDSKTYEGSIGILAPSKKGEMTPVYQFESFDYFLHVVGERRVNTYWQIPRSDVDGLNGISHMVFQIPSDVDVLKGNAPATAKPLLTRAKVTVKTEQGARTLSLVGYCAKY